MDSDGTDGAAVRWDGCRAILLVLTVWASTGRAADPVAGGGFLPLDLGDAVVGNYVFADDAILRPFIAGLRDPDGVQVTRHHPPRPGRDADDHATMHPGLWLGFGAVSGTDLWRNRGRIVHERFAPTPSRSDGVLRFGTESALLDESGRPLGRLEQRVRVGRQPAGTLVLWIATFHAVGEPLEFGDQEEMGFGVRVAAGMAEKDGGRVVNAAGLETAAGAWGRPADWCDLSGVVDGRPAGVTVMASPRNFRPAWWHVRDYGLAVANPFGRAALAHGEPSRVFVRPGEPLRLTFGVMARGTATAADAWEAFLAAEAEELAAPRR